MGNLEIVKWSHFARDSVLDIPLNKVSYVVLILLNKLPLAGRIWWEMFQFLLNTFIRIRMTDKANTYLYLAIVSDSCTYRSL